VLGRDQELLDDREALRSNRKAAAAASLSELREALLRFIGSFAAWDLSSNGTYLAVSRELVRPLLSRA